jgi:hypothetical protein
MDHYLFIFHLNQIKMMNISERSGATGGRGKGEGEGEGKGKGKGDSPSTQLEDKATSK